MLKLFVAALVLGGIFCLPAQAQPKTTKTKGQEVKDRMDKKVDDWSAKEKERQRDNSKSEKQAQNREKEIDRQAAEKKKLNEDAVKKLGPKANEPYDPDKDQTRKKNPPEKKKK